MIANGIANGRFTADHSGPLVVFLIGMRINNFRKIGKWLPVARAMGPMIRELSSDSESGFLGAQFLLASPRTVLVVQYWRDFDRLEAYARARDKKHWPAWRAFNKAVGNGGAAGIFHETYCVPEGGSETIYVNMPSFGLGKTAGLVPASGPPNRARKAGAARERLKNGADIG